MHCFEWEVCLSLPVWSRPVSALQGEWQLLFNYIIPFGELLDQSGQTLRSSTGVRITLGTEAVSVAMETGGEGGGGEAPCGFDLFHFSLCRCVSSWFLSAWTSAPITTECTSWG